MDYTVQTWFGRTWFLSSVGICQLFSPNSGRTQSFDALSRHDGPVAARCLVAQKNAIPDSADTFPTGAGRRRPELNQTQPAHNEIDRQCSSIVFLSFLSCFFAICSCSFFSFLSFRIWSWRLPPSSRLRQFLHSVLLLINRLQAPEHPHTRRRPLRRSLLPPRLPRPLPNPTPFQSSPRSLQVRQDQPELQRLRPPRHSKLRHDQLNHPLCPLRRRRRRRAKS